METTARSNNAWFEMTSANTQIQPPPMPPMPHDEHRHIESDYEGDTSISMDHGDQEQGKGWKHTDQSTHKKTSVKVVNLSYTVGDKKILRDVTATAHGGRVLAVMGPSGSGKTTLTNCICGRIAENDKSKMDGKIMLNSKVTSKKNLRKNLAVVTQEDTVYETATPREILEFGLRMRSEKRLSKKEISDHVNQLIDRLKLRQCADTIVGSPGLVRGISGGERKRTNIASELISNPSVMLMDEPTTGLDSVNALQLMQLLKELARIERRTIIVTIHQPSSEIFELFDDLLLISNGRVVYADAARDAVQYFHSQGFPCPEHYNPSDFFMEVVERDQEMDVKKTKGEAPPDTETLADKWALYQQRKATQMSPVTEQQIAIEAAEEGDVIRTKAPLFEQFLALNQRAFRHAMRNRMQIGSTIGMSLFMCIILIPMFWNVGHSQQSIQDREGYLFTLSMNLVFTGVFSNAMGFTHEKPIFLREQASALYHPAIYFMAKFVCEIPTYVIASTVLCVPTYFSSHMYRSADAFFIFYFTLILANQVCRSIGLFLSAVAPNIQAVMAITPLTVVPMIFGGGLVASRSRLEGFWTWLRYYSVMHYPFVIIANNEFKRIDCFSCSQQLDACEPGVVNTCPLNNGKAALHYFGLDQDKIWVQYLVLCCIGVAAAIAAIIALTVVGGRRRS